ncbi:hypothetical protein BKA70DRAFT_1424225 [Coprinopsis sp. MPI-PUGE-AT-0042]|nr:hypothetical protein BKA70DRAFT_1424225 [Coprinopsis sp. MPI-PUGE-AT-0042]
MSSPRHPEDASTPPPPNSDAVNHEANPPPPSVICSPMGSIGTIMLLSWSISKSSSTPMRLDRGCFPNPACHAGRPSSLHTSQAADDTIFRSDGGDGYSYSLDDPQVITPTRCTQFKRGRSDIELEWGEVMKRESKRRQLPYLVHPPLLPGLVLEPSPSSSTGIQESMSTPDLYPMRRGRIEALTEDIYGPHRATNSRSVGALASLVAAAEHILQPRAPLSVLPKPPIPSELTIPLTRTPTAAAKARSLSNQLALHVLSFARVQPGVKRSRFLLWYQPSQHPQLQSSHYRHQTNCLQPNSCTSHPNSHISHSHPALPSRNLWQMLRLSNDPSALYPPIPSTGTSSSSHRQVATLRQPSLLTLILASNDGIDSGCRVLDASAYIIQSLESSRAEVPASTFAYDDVHLNVDAVHLQRVGFGLSFPMESLVDLVKLALADTAIAQFVPLQVEEFYACLERDIDTRQNGELRRLVPRAFDQLGDELMGSSYTSQSPDTVIKIPTAAHSFQLVLFDVTLKSTIPPPNDSAISIRQTQFGAGLGRPAVTASLLTTTTTTTPPQPPPPSTILLVMRGSPPATGRPVDAKRLKQSITSPHLFWEARCIDQNHHHYYFRLSQKTAPIQVSIETTKRVHAKGYEDSRCLSPSRADLSP